jgi:alpha/beta superfamily hydrolase
MLSTSSSTCATSEPRITSLQLVGFSFGTGMNVSIWYEHRHTVSSNLYQCRYTSYIFKACEWISGIIIPLHYKLL